VLKQSKDPKKKKNIDHQDLFFNLQPIVKPPTTMSTRIAIEVPDYAAVCAQSLNQYCFARWHFIIGRTSGIYGILKKIGRFSWSFGSLPSGLLLGLVADSGYPMLGFWNLSWFSF
jgi:hypothetical protein